MFFKFDINFDRNIYDELLNSVEYENITTGRKGAIIVDSYDNITPIVRTTTAYNNSYQKFSQIHYELINKIKQVSNNNKLEFNNAMIELYNNQYTNMKYHTDQSLDLQENSYICLFSCYDNPDTTNLRTLQIKNKITNECFEYVLNHNSIILFSLDTNSKHLHKIILKNKNNSNTNWIGLTLRLSKTFIHFKQDMNELKPYFYNTNDILRFASDNEIKEFRIHKSNENKYIDYIYPDIKYTISKSDLLQIKK